jgi:pimeloyl-ACP methyl ester carboxylesterase
MIASVRSQRLNLAFAVVSIVAIICALWALRAADSGQTRETVSLSGTPATIFRPAVPRPAPVIMIAHGFAGSQQLMQGFASTLARNGYIAVTFDFPGHGRNSAPLMGSITQVDGATQTLVRETEKVAAFARSLGDGRLAVLGHSMASDIVVRFAQAHSEVAATIAVSMFSPAVTAATPRNLLVIDGEYEGALRREALRAVALAASPGSAIEPGITYGDVKSGTARRAAVSKGVEHIGVLYSRDGMKEALAWLDATFGVSRERDPTLDGRGPWIAVLLLGIVLLARPLFALLPVVCDPPVGAGLGWRRLWVPLMVPMIATPLMLRVLPTHFLPVLVADYLAAHFALYGLITTACLFWQRRPTDQRPTFEGILGPLAAAVLLLIVFEFCGVVWPINHYFTSFVPGPERYLLVLAMLMGTLLFFLSDEWLTRGAGSAPYAYLASKSAFLVSLGLAVGLDFSRLFFLIIIVPAIIVFFLMFGLFSGWAYQRTGHPWAAALANAISFAWALGVTFPLLAG